MIPAILTVHDIEQRQTCTYSSLILLLSFSFPCSDGNIRYFEYEGDEIYTLSEFGSNVPQRGMAFMPKRALNVNDCEIARAYKVSNGMVEPISFTVPRKVPVSSFYSVENRSCGISMGF